MTGYHQPNAAGAPQQLQTRKAVKWREWMTGLCKVMIATARDKPGTAAGIAVGEERGDRPPPLPPARE